MSYLWASAARAAAEIGARDVNAIIDEVIAAVKRWPDFATEAKVSQFLLNKFSTA